MIWLVTGGSGCGKSTWAEKLVQSLPGEKRIYIATMQVYDQESEKRVMRHRAQRADLGFLTVECEKNLSAAQIDAGSVVLLEDLVNLTANEMFDGGDPNRVIPDLLDVSKRCNHLIMVTNDLFSDGETYSSSVQEYLRCLAEVNRQAAILADHVIEVVYSIPVALKGELPCL
jgi:adenosylcobinamide kinase/adenosylcobinamide-phosphate guanylyltransferase